MNRLLTVAIALIPLLAPTVAAQTGTTSDQTNPTICPNLCPQCPLTWEVKPYPKRVIPNVFVGWNNGTSYLDNGLLGPMLVPLEIQTRDEDELHTFCAGGCTKQPWHNDWTIKWEVSGFDPQNPYPFQHGSFVDAQAVRRGVLDDRWAVLYLPPEDLQVGDSRAITITATIRDLCGDGKDKEATVKFTGTIARLDATWSVDIQYSPPPKIPDEQQEECRGSSKPCELVGQSILPEGPPTKRFSDLPSYMYVDEVRALTFAAEDKDKVRAECGIPNQTCSTFCHKLICDELSYDWFVTNPTAQYEGQGVIEAFGSFKSGNTHIPRGQTAMFSATKAGRVRLQIVADSTEAGDWTLFEHDIEILERRVRRIDHKPDGQHAIYKDGSLTEKYSSMGEGNAGIEYIDVDGNGVATDENDQNFPMAYTAKAQPQLQLFREDAPAAAAGADVMPGAVIVGIDSSLGLQYLAPQDWLQHLQDPDKVNATDFTTFGKLPSVAGKWDHKVTWEVIYTLVRPVAHTPSHVYRVYTSLKNPRIPTSPLYRNWESGWDISCRGGHGAANATNFLSNLRTHFGTLNVPRKAKDGFNVSDGTPLVFWGNVGDSIPDDATSASLKEMLTRTGAAGDGYGRCGPMVQLMRLCMGIQGEVADSTVFQLKLYVRRKNPAGTPSSFVPVPPNALALLSEPAVSFVINGPNLALVQSTSAAELMVWTNLAQPPDYLDPPVVVNGTDPGRPLAGGGGRPYYVLDTTEPHNAAWATMSNVHGPPAVGGALATTPKTHFDNHELMSYGGKLYDPSYGGAEFNSLDAYVTAKVRTVMVPLDIIPAAGPIPDYPKHELHFDYWSTGPYKPEIVPTNSSIY